MSKQTRNELREAKRDYKKAQSELKAAKREYKIEAKQMNRFPKPQSRFEKRYFETKQSAKKQIANKEIAALKEKKKFSRVKKRQAIQRNGGTAIQKAGKGAHYQASQFVDSAFQDNDVLEDISAARQKIRRTHADLRQAKKAGKYTAKISKTATRNIYGAGNRTYNLIRHRGFTRTPKNMRWETKLTNKYQRLRARMRLSKPGKIFNRAKQAFSYVKRPIVSVLKNPLAIKAYLIIFLFFFGLSMLSAIFAGGSSTVVQNEFDLTETWIYLSKIDREKSTDQVDYWTNIDDIMTFMGYKHGSYRLNDAYNAKDKGWLEFDKPYSELLSTLWNELNGDKDHLKTITNVYINTQNQYLKLNAAEVEEYRKISEQANKVGKYIAYLELRNPFFKEDVLESVTIIKRFGYVSKEDLYQGSILKANKDASLYAVMSGTVKVAENNITIQTDKAAFTYQNVTNAKVLDGEAVKVGQEIGSVGSDDGQEVFYSKLKDKKEWVYVNPGFYMPTVSYNQTTSVLANMNIEGDVAKKIREVYNYLKKYDPNITVNGVAAVLGNFWTESYITAKRAEGDFLEPPIGASAYSWDDEGWLSMGGPAIYKGMYPNIVKRGLGLGQWTDTLDGSLRHTALRQYAKNQNKKWYDLELQIDFMLRGDSPYYIRVLNDILHSNEDVATLTQQFLVKWEGNPGDKLKQRQHNANQVLVYLKNPPGSARGSSATLQSSWNFPQQYQDKLASFPSGNTVSASLDGNTYPVGQCTWYVYNRLVDAGAPRHNWLGNGQDWVRSLIAKGWTFSDQPVAGAVMSTKGGFDHTSAEYGHVSYVEYVNEDGTFLVSECNWAGVQNQIHWAEKKNASYYTFAIPPKQ